MRSTHFRVEGLKGFGQNVGRVTIEQTASGPLLTVRPLHSGTPVSMFLSEVAQIVLERDAKARISARAKR